MKRGTDIVPGEEGLFQCFVYTPYLHLQVKSPAHPDREKEGRRRTQRKLLACTRTLCRLECGGERERGGYGFRSLSTPRSEGEGGKGGRESEGKRGVPCLSRFHSHPGAIEISRDRIALPFGEKREEGEGVNYFLGETPRSNPPSCGRGDTFRLYTRREEGRFWESGRRPHTRERGRAALLR